MNIKWSILSGVVALGAMIAIGCATAPSSDEGKADIEKAAAETVKKLKTTDPDSEKHYFSTAKAWAVFPTVGKGGVGLGGAYGKGVFYEGGSVVGYCDLTQGTIGFQLGGQAFSEIVFFENEKAVADFKKGEFTFAAQVSAVAASAGASAKAKYAGGIAVFVLGETGLMYEASVGGQNFSYQAKK